MPLTIPNLDDRAWVDLVEEGRSMIPASAPEWTDHNPSDPGITLMELFAYLTEMLLYRTNRISERNVIAFLRLLHGDKDWRPHLTLDESVREAELELRKLQRAVTAEDFEILARDVKDVGRAKCLPRRNLESSHAQAHSQDTPGHVTVLVLPEVRARPTDELLKWVRRALEPARLLGTRIHVCPPGYVSIAVRFALVLKAGAIPAKVRAQAHKAVERFFDPLPKEGEGWPFGRHVYVSELYQILGAVPGVDSVRKTVAPKSGTPLDEIYVAPAEEYRLRRNKLGQLEAVELKPHELVIAQVEENDFTI